MSESNDSTKALTFIRQYFERDDPDRWIWESLVEDAARKASITANSRDGEAVCASASALRKAYPYKNPKDWLLRLRKPAESENILHIIQSEFKRVAEMPADRRLCDLAAVFGRAERLLGGNQGILHGYLTEILREPRRKYMSSETPSCMGVYGLWWSAEVELPIYVGEGNLRSRLDSHKCMWWGDSSMHVNFLISDELNRDSMRLLVERFLIETIRPEINKK